MIKNINDHLLNGNLDEALRLVDDVILNDQWYYPYHEKKAEILLRMDDRDSAAESLRNAIRIRPDLEYLGLRLKWILKPAAADDTMIRHPICGIHARLPDGTGKRKAEGGLRMHGARKISNKEYPLVSIVTVVFNNPLSLAACIESVRNQDYPNIEHVIIDGGSEDPTLDVIRAHEDTIDYYVSEPDLGIYHGMNKGISAAVGEYICLLNSDDTYAPSFVSKTVSLAKERGSQVVFTDYIHGENPVSSRGMNPGILFGHLNINHGTFLASRECYDLVGPYLEDYRIVSDAVWMRAAFKMGVRFDHLTEPLFHFAAEGLSSGATPVRRVLFISEVVRSYTAEFDFLTKEEAESIYLLRFNMERIPGIVEIYDRHAGQGRFREALSCYVEHCMRDRDNFRLSERTPDWIFSAFLEACERLGLSISSIRLLTKMGCLSDIISSIDLRISRRKTKPVRTILHFLSVFSAPSETFIYDLLLRLERDTGFDNFVLHEHSLLEDSRPFEKRFWIPWNDFSPLVRDAIYLHIFEALGPDLVIGHFALNSWKLETRIRPLNINVPVLSMTHGIDVFVLEEQGAYRDYMLDDYIKRVDTRFTTVSEFLRDRLVSSGIPPEKINLVYNSINPRFFNHRKTSGYRSAGVPLRMLAVGRLIDWKGHRFLLEALAIVRSRVDVDASLTIVYANSGDLLEETTALIDKLGLASQVELIPYVDFHENPDFHTRFDLFVHPTTYSDDPLKRTETFGMSVLEAIAAGLPVVVTDAGGIPEVVGAPNCFARIVPHGNAEALAEGILDAIQDPSCFADNLEYALQRLSKFAISGQTTALSKAIFQTKPGRIRAALFTSSTHQGAGYAAYRLHRGFLRGDAVQSTLYATVPIHEGEPGVVIISHPTTKSRDWQALQNPAISKPDLTIFTVNHPTILNRRLATMVENADIINLHWTARFLSIENIAYLTNLGKPVVLTLRDMFPITGGCHFFHGCDGWTKSCGNCPQLVDHWDNYPARALQAKRSHYNFRNLTLVTLSQHSAEILRRAPNFQDCRIEVIPNSIETDVFHPRGRAESRARFGLPDDRKIIAYVPSYSSEVKGYREATLAIALLNEIRPDLNPLILLIGNETPATDGIANEKHILGYIHDNEVLSAAYSAADVVIVPSLEETFSNTTAEAISCGTPVVGFRTGAIPEMAVNNLTGVCVDVGDVEGFTRGIASILDGGNLGENCRKFAQDWLEFGIQAKRYEDLFVDLLAAKQNETQQWSAVVPDAFGETTLTVLELTKRGSDRFSASIRG